LKQQLTISAVIYVLAVSGITQLANAQQDGECADGLCGTPRQSGGGDANSSVLIQGADLGQTQQFGDDYDEDGIEDAIIGSDGVPRALDNCPFVYNPLQLDADSDSFGDACDVCTYIPSPVALDTDDDGAGDACDSDIDGDGVANDADGCKFIADAAQLDTDGDGRGNACDADDDNDGFIDVVDFCPLVASTESNHNDLSAAVCDTDIDQDGINDVFDLCDTIANDDQSDVDGDGIGDACDGDIDDDFVPNSLDNCNATSNIDQSDIDGDNVGDVCDNVTCYVIDRNNIDNCLNVNAPLAVFAGGEERIRVGETVALRIRANHSDAMLSYMWSVIQLPDDSDAVPKFATGRAVHAMKAWFMYEHGAAATFTPDVNGVYTLGLVVKDENDESYAYDVLDIEAYGDTVIGGCSMTGF